MTDAPPNSTRTPRKSELPDEHQTVSDAAASRPRQHLVTSPHKAALRSDLQEAGFTLLSELGRGGMGAVYKAYDEELDRTVALKLLHRNDDLATDALLAEARAAAKLSHPNVAAVHSVGVAGDRVFMAMELVEGESLKEWAGKAHKLRQILAVFTQAARGLAAAHRVGIVHRDFKPHNVMVGADGRARVLDFGLARSGDRPSDSDLLSVEASTAAGTPAYMAPEQTSGGAITAAADQYAFCASLFEAVVGARPFQGASIDEITRRKWRHAIASRRGARTMPFWLWRIVRRGLAPDPARRHASMDVLANKLAHGIPRAGINFALVLASVASALVMATVAAQVIWHSPLKTLEDAEAASVDMRFVNRGPIDARNDIVIVGLDDRTRVTHPETFQTRRGWARLITAISRHSPKVIGLDVFFASPESLLPPAVVTAIREGRVAAAQRLPAGDPIRLALDLVEISISGDRMLARAIAQAGNVVLGHLFFLVDHPSPIDIPPLPNAVTRWDSRAGASSRFNASTALGSLPAIQSGAAGGGALNILPDRHGVVRSVPAAIRLGQTRYAPMAIAVAAIVRSGIPTSRDEDGTIRLGHTELPTYDGVLQLNHIGPGGSFRTISAADILTGTADAGMLTGSSVFVGLTDTARDKVRTPYDPRLSGVELHATLLQNVLDGRLLRMPSRATALLIPFLMCLALCLVQLAVFPARAWILLALWCVLSFGYLVVCVRAFTNHDLVLPMALPLSGLLLVSVAAGCGHLAAALRARRTTLA